MMQINKHLKNLAEINRYQLCHIDNKVCLDGMMLWDNTLQT